MVLRSGVLYVDCSAVGSIIDRSVIVLEAYEAHNLSNIDLHR
jgi:hypothetical protein